MSKVKYTGTSDFQIFGADDFKKAGVEGKKMTFPHDEPVEVSEEIAAVLTSKEGIFGDFGFEEVKEEETEATPAEEPKGQEKPLATSGKKATTEGTANPSDGPSGPDSTGAGSSTR